MEAPQAQRALAKSKSWSPETLESETWRRRRELHRERRRNPLSTCRSVTEDDLDELRGCLELGFRFDSPEDSRRLSPTLPALELFLITPPSPSSSSTSTTASPVRFYSPDDDPEIVKEKLKQWAQIVAGSLRRQC